MTEADEDTAIANAEAFCRTLEAIARTLPKVALATHPALGTGAVGGAAVAPGDVGDHLRAARAFEAVVAGDTGCLLYTSPSPRDLSTSRMPSSA